MKSFAVTEIDSKETAPEEREKSVSIPHRVITVAWRNFRRGGKEDLLPIMTIGTGAALIFTTQVFTHYLREQALLIASLFGSTGSSESILSSTYWISTMIIIIGALETVIVMSRNVIRRTREIGIMKAVGIDSKIIAVIIDIETFLYGAIGGVVGVLAGLVMVLLVGLSQLSLEPILVLAPLVPLASSYAFVLALIPSIAGGIYPSFRAIQLTVLEAISHDI